MPAAGNPKAAELLILVSVYFVLLLIPQWTWNPTQTHRIKTLNSSTKKIIQIINTVIAHSINVEDLRKLETTLVEYQKELLSIGGRISDQNPKIITPNTCQICLKIMDLPQYFLAGQVRDSLVRLL